jgi:hypothetical protein
MGSTEGVSSKRLLCFWALINIFYFSEQAELEREKLLASGAMDDVSPQDLLQRSDFHIRNRYLSRIGAVVSDLPV